MTSGSKCAAVRSDTETEGSRARSPGLVGTFNK